MNKDFLKDIEDYNKSCQKALDSLKSLINNGVTTKELMFAIQITHEIVTDCFEMNMKYGEENVPPVKHGKWSECYTDSHHYSGICSVCGKASIRNPQSEPYEFCPRCGADMRGNGG